MGIRLAQKSLGLPILPQRRNPPRKNPPSRMPTRNPRPELQLHHHSIQRNPANHAYPRELPVVPEVLVGEVLARRQAGKLAVHQAVLEHPEKRKILVG